MFVLWTCRCTDARMHGSTDTWMRARMSGHPCFQPHPRVPSQTPSIPPGPKNVPAAPMESIPLPKRVLPGRDPTIWELHVVYVVFVLNMFEFVLFMFEQ